MKIEDSLSDVIREGAKKELYNAEDPKKYLLNVLPEKLSLEEYVGELYCSNMDIKMLEIDKAITIKMYTYSLQFKNNLIWKGSSQRRGFQIVIPQDDHCTLNMLINGIDYLLSEYSHCIIIEQNKVIKNHDKHI